MFTIEDKPWFEVYKAAVLELEPEKLPGRIVEAKEAVQMRLKDIQGDTDHREERHQIEDALNNLRTLERFEVTPSLVRSVIQSGGRHSRTFRSYLHASISCLLNLQQGNRTRNHKD